MAFAIASPPTISLCQAVSQAIHARARCGAHAGYEQSRQSLRKIRPLCFPCRTATADGIIAGDPVFDLEAISLGQAWSVRQIKAITPPPIQKLSNGLPILYPAFPVSDQNLFQSGDVAAAHNPVAPPNARLYASIQPIYTGSAAIPSA
jgi:hypothetical protein